MTIENVEKKNDTLKDELLNLKNLVSIYQPAQMGEVRKTLR
jgi:ribosomal protein L29